MKKILKLMIVLLILAGYPFLILVWHPWQMEKDLSMVQVPVAKKTLYYRTEITEEDIVYLKLPKSFIQEKMILNAEEILNKVVSDEIMIAEGSYFTEEMLDDASLIQDKAVLSLKKGQAAYAINTDFIQTLGSTLQINQKIDLYCMISNRNENPIVDLLIEAVRIIDIKDRKGLALDDPQGTGIAGVIVVAVDQSLIPLLTMANEKGTLQLVVTSQAWNEKEECILNEKSILMDYITINKQ